MNKVLSVAIIIAILLLSARAFAVDWEVEVEYITAFDKQPIKDWKILFLDKEDIKNLKFKKGEIQ